MHNKTNLKILEKNKEENYIISAYYSITLQCPYIFQMLLPNYSVVKNTCKIID